MVNKHRTAASGLFALIDNPHVSTFGLCRVLNMRSNEDPSGNSQNSLTAGQAHAREGVLSNVLTLDSFERWSFPV